MNHDPFANSLGRRELRMCEWQQVKSSALLTDALKRARTSDDDDEALELSLSSSRSNPLLLDAIRRCIEMKRRF